MPTSRLPRHLYRNRLDQFHIHLSYVFEHCYVRSEVQQSNWLLLNEELPFSGGTFKTSLQLVLALVSCIRSISKWFPESLILTFSTITHPQIQPLKPAGLWSLFNAFLSL